jgi:hypothetical protein
MGCIVSHPPRPSLPSHSPQPLLCLPNFQSFCQFLTDPCTHLHTHSLTHHPIHPPVPIVSNSPQPLLCPRYPQPPTHSPLPTPPIVMYPPTYPPTHKPILLSLHPPVLIHWNSPQPLLHPPYPQSHHPSHRHRHPPQPHPAPRCRCRPQQQASQVPHCCCRCC